MRPSVVHFGKTRAVQIPRQCVLNKAYEQNPERFSRGVPYVPMPPPQKAWINPPQKQQMRPPKPCDPA